MVPLIPHHLASVSLYSASTVCHDIQQQLDQQKAAVFIGSLQLQVSCRGSEAPLGNGGQRESIYPRLPQE